MNGRYGKGGYGGLGLIAQSDVFPTYYTYQMYKVRTELIYSSSDDPDLSVYTAAGRRRPHRHGYQPDARGENKSRQIGDRGQVQAEAWLFIRHKAEKVGKWKYLIK
jgi:hypothetical protein